MDRLCRLLPAFAVYEPATAATNGLPVMLSRLAKIFSDSAGNTRSKIAGIYSVLLGANLLAWIWAFIAFRDHPVMLGTALLRILSGCAMPSTPITSPPSTTSPASSCKRVSVRWPRASSFHSDTRR